MIKFNRHLVNMSVASKASCFNLFNEKLIGMSENHKTYKLRSLIYCRKKQFKIKSDVSKPKQSQLFVF